MIYQNLEDALYNVVEALFPTWRIIFAYGNGPEPQTPYTVIDVRKIDPVGRERLTTTGEVLLSGNIQTITHQDQEVQVRFELIGKYDDNTTLGEMVNDLQVALRSQRGFELQAANTLALHKMLSIRRIPVKRETDMYMVYQLDATFAYTAQMTDENDWIDAVGLTGVYHDAGREPDHVIINNIEINYP